VEALDRGAVENWLIRTLRHARKNQRRLDWTFYCTLERPGVMDDTARSIGARVVHSKAPLASKAKFIHSLCNELKRGQYDILHCHHDLVSAVYLLAAFGMRLHRRIVHVHNADESLPTRSRLKRYLCREPMRQLCLTMADRIVGISNHTLDSFLAGRPRRPEHDSVQYYGVDPEPFQSVVADRARFRRECDLPGTALILLFAGRIVPEKNPVFVIDVLASLRHIQPDVFAVFVGSGSLIEHVIARAKALGVEDSIRLLGWRSDLPEIMSCSDWFILPHPEYPPEGFGLAVVEAQLAGLRMLLSCGVPDDPLLSTASFRRLSVSEGPDLWAKAAVELLRQSAPSRAAARVALGKSPMDMDRALNGLLSLYAC
jgi:glycosyltransferase involved in cell wall biosynthesis